ncbi:unnamed protein product [Toxocara canis]|uniref:Glycosyl transferase n=1 Tax=Toxocara canis TaxID=6265 RepID=A0A183TW02_TOXCA|nr:unnamed protein product [Toxocara canis]
MNVLQFMFARHCVTALKLSEEQAQWILFVDADMAVINPNRLIEEWIDEDVNIIFYNRIFNYEIAAGSYLVKNTNYSRNFLQLWASYDRKLPNSLHGTDNGAIQVLLSTFFNFLKYQKTQDLYVYEACARSILGQRSKWPGQLSILPKGASWVRDTWLTNSMWSQRDFILHGWQLRKLDAVTSASWPSPLTTHEFNLSTCGSEKAGHNWQYKDTFMRSDEEIQAQLKQVIDYSYRMYLNDLGKVDSYT